MELSDEQYNLISRYLGGELTREEHENFEISLHENEALRNEMMLFREIMALSESVENKISRAAELNSLGRPGSMDFTIIEEARKNWENQYEESLQKKLGIQDIPIGSKRPDTLVPRTKIRSIRTWRWVAAAVIAGAILLGIAWWNTQYRSDVSRVAGNKQDSTRHENGIKEDTGKAGGTNPGKITNEDLNAKNNNQKNEASVKINELFDNYFIPDKAPQIIEGPLETAFSLFSRKMYNKAISAFNNADFGPPSRGDDEARSLQVFYTHYYKSLSYMAANTNSATAEKEMKLAVQTSPDKLWQSKAKWYLALSKMKNGHNKDAIILLKELVASSDSTKIKNQASKLLQELEPISN